MSDKYAELEIKIAYLEQGLQKLSDEYFEQQQELAKLKRSNGVLQNQIDSLNDSLGDESTVVDDRPPHY